MPERNRFFKGLSSWIGFRQVRVDYEPAEREHGVTTWNVWTLIGLSIEGLDLVFGGAAARRQPARPAAGADRARFRRLDRAAKRFFGKDVPGYPSLVVGVMVIGGVQLIMIGVLGEYIGKMLSEIKGRPVYFVAEHSVKRAEQAAKARPRRLLRAAE